MCIHRVCNCTWISVVFASFNMLEFAKQIMTWSSKLNHPILIYHVPLKVGCHLSFSILRTKTCKYTTNYNTALRDRCFFNTSRDTCFINSFALSYITRLYCKLALIIQWIFEVKYWHADVLLVLSLICLRIDTSEKLTMNERDYMSCVKCQGLIGGDYEI